MRPRQGQSLEEHSVRLMRIMVHRYLNWAVWELWNEPVGSRQIDRIHIVVENEKSQNLREKIH